MFASNYRSFQSWLQDGFATNGIISFFFGVFFRNGIINIKRVNDINLDVTLIPAIRRRQRNMSILYLAI